MNWAIFLARVLALPQNQWGGLDMKPRFAHQITVVMSDRIGVETHENFQRDLSRIC